MSDEEDVIDIDDANEQEEDIADEEMVHDAEGEEEEEEEDAEGEAEDAEGEDDEEEDDEDAATEADEEEEGGESESDGESSQDETMEDAEEVEPTPASRVSASPRPAGLPTRPSSRSTTPEATTRSESPASRRKHLLRAPPPAFKSYMVDPICAIPHPCPTNALAASMCMTHLLTGSDDGYVRNYDVYGAVNGRTFLTAAQRAHCGLGDSMMRAGILRCWWPAGTSEVVENGMLSPVSAMACHSDALWALSGNLDGEIHLYTVRHEPGLIHHVFNHHKAVITTLALQPDEMGFYSGSHDNHVLHWDLNTGQVTRTFNHPNGQITALGLRPFNPPSAPWETLAAVNLQDDSQKTAVGEDTQQTTGNGAGQIANGLASSPAGSPMDAKSEGSYDPLFDDAEGTGDSGRSSRAPTANATQPETPLQGLSLPGQSASLDGLRTAFAPPPPVVNPRKHGALLLDSAMYADFSKDVLMTATFDGSVLLWDRREPGKVGRLENDRAPPWCLAACWSHTGNEIMVGRRNATIDIFDVRQPGKTYNGPRLIRTLSNPSDSKTVTALAAFPDGRHLVCASEDNLRLWNVWETPEEKAAKRGLPPFKLIPGHHGGVVSQILIDIRQQFLVTASGPRQWHGQSTRTVLIHSIQGFI